MFFCILTPKLNGFYKNPPNYFYVQSCLMLVYVNQDSVSSCETVSYPVMCLWSLIVVLISKPENGTKGTQEPSMLSMEPWDSVCLQLIFPQSSMGNVNFPTFIRENTCIFLFKHKHTKLYGWIKLFLFSKLPGD